MNREEPENIKTKRRTWKSFNIDRSFSSPEQIVRERTFLIEDLDSKGGLLGGQDGGRSQDCRQVDEDGGRENEGRIKETDISPRYGQVVPALRAKLAEQGCSESQLYLARELLIEAASLDEEEEEKSRLEENAMYWLLQATQQGLEEARSTLLSMYWEGRGVTDLNYPDIAAIARLPKEALAAADLGSTLFASLSKGYNYVTPLQLAKLSQDTALQNCTVHVKYTGNSGKLDKELVVQAVAQYMQSDLPEIDKKVGEFRKPGWNKLTLFLPLLFNVLYMCLYTSLTRQTILTQVLLLLSCFIFFRTQNLLQRFQVWSKILTRFNSGLKTDQYEKLYSEKTKIELVAIFVFIASFFLCDSGCDLILFCAATILSILLVVYEKRLGLLYLSIYIALLTGNQSISENITVSDPKSLLFCSRVMAGAVVLISTGLNGLISLVWLNLSYIAHLESNLEKSPSSSSRPSSVERYLDLNLVLILGFIYLLYLAFKTRKGRFILLCLLFLKLGSVQHHDREQSRAVSELTWLQYEQNCLQSSSISTTATCEHYSGLLVEWRGEVEAVVIHSRRNIIQQLVNLLPRVVLENIPMTCWFGDKYKNCTQKPTQTARDLCKYKSTSSDPVQLCHLEVYSRYEYMITLRMEKGLFSRSTPLQVMVQHPLGASVQGLKPGDQLHFVGRLQGVIAGNGPRVSLISILEK